MTLPLGKRTDEWMKVRGSAKIVLVNKVGILVKIIYNDIALFKEWRP